MTLTPQTANEAAYELLVWKYAYAPIEYRELFDVPDPEHPAYIVYQRKIVNSWGIDWVAPNSTWWILWHHETVRQLDEHTTVYLLVDKIKGQPP